MDGTMEQAATRNGTGWDLEADVVVIGSGAAGLPAAIKAVEGGASVLVVEANYDVGGHAIAHRRLCLQAAKISLILAIVIRWIPAIDGSRPSSLRSH